MPSLLEILGGPVRGLVDGIGGIIDNLSTTDEEKLEAKAKLETIANGFALQIANAQRDIIIAETKSDSWLSRSWRPIVMLTFAGLIVAHWLGFTPPNLPNDQVLALLEIVKLGLAGYVVGRSAEKVVREWKNGKS